MITYHCNDVSTIEDATALCVEVFPDKSGFKDKYYNVDYWHKLIDNNGFLVTAYDGDIIVGFAVCYEKSDEALHIWMVGVKESHRDQGIWTEMYRRIHEYALEREYKKISVHVYQLRSPRMYNFVSSRSFFVTNVSDMGEHRGVRTTFETLLSNKDSAMAEQ